MLVQGTIEPRITVAKAHRRDAAPSQNAATNTWLFLLTRAAQTANKNTAIEKARLQMGHRTEVPSTRRTARRNTPDARSGRISTTSGNAYLTKYDLRRSWEFVMRLDTGLEIAVERGEFVPREGVAVKQDLVLIQI
jgi:hypothetical protein